MKKVALSLSLMSAMSLTLGDIHHPLDRREPRQLIPTDRPMPDRKKKSTMKKDKAKKHNKKKRGY